jgi:hypothetical protein
MNLDKLTAPLINQATSVIAPNVSIPLMAAGETCLHAGVVIDQATDGIGIFP